MVKRTLINFTFIVTKYKNKYNKLNAIELVLMSTGNDGMLATIN